MPTTARVAPGPKRTGLPSPITTTSGLSTQL
jgi:hypothetical protein